MKPVMMVGVGRMGRGYVDAAVARGLSVVVVEAGSVIEDLRRAYPGLLVDVEVVATSAADFPEAWVAPAMRLAARTAPDAVLAFTETHVLAAALVQEKLGLPGPSLAAALVSRNKALQRARFDVAGVAQPAHELVEAAPSMLPGAGPWVVKPLSSMGSDGVHLVESEVDLRASLDRRAGHGPQLIEAYVSGAEYSWEAIVQGGEPVFTNVTRKFTTDPPYFVEVRHVAGVGAVEPVVADAVQEVGRAAIRALGVEDSIVHLEVRQGADGRPMVIEMAVRAPGDFLMEVIGAAHGIDVFDACVQVARGLPPDIPGAGATRRAAASLFFSAPRRGRFAGIELSRVCALPGVQRAEARLSPGAEVGPPRSSWERPAYALVVAENAVAVNEVCERALEAVEWTVVDDYSSA